MQSNKPADKNFKLELQHFKKVKFSFYRNVKNLVRKITNRVELIADDSKIYYILRRNTGLIEMKFKKKMIHMSKHMRLDKANG